MTPANTIPDPDDPKWRFNDAHARPVPPNPVKPKTPFWDRRSTWTAISWAILIGGLLLFNLGGLWRWPFFGG